MTGARLQRQDLESWETNGHRGPYRLMLYRPGKKPGQHTSEWLKTSTPRDEVLEEAIAYLTDPRDTVIGVYVYSLGESQFVHGFRRVS